MQDSGVTAAYAAVNLGNHRREPEIRCGIPELTTAYAAVKLGNRRRKPEIRCGIPEFNRGICRGYLWKPPGLSTKNALALTIGAMMRTNEYLIFTTCGDTLTLNCLANPTQRFNSSRTNQPHTADANARISPYPCGHRWGTIETLDPFKSPCRNERWKTERLRRGRE